MAELGYWTIVLTFVVSIYTVVALILGIRRGSVTLGESARNGVLLALIACSISLLVLVYLLIGRDFSLAYVYEHVNVNLPTLYTISALWAGQEGSLLLWLWMVTVISAILVARQRATGHELGAYVLAVLTANQAFLALVLVLVSNPFARLPTLVSDGQGLNPLLQNLWMVVHPPVVFAGYAAYTVPFALVLGGLITGQMQRNWLVLVRRWAFLAWLLLGAGIMMGSVWAYEELGWGGYWGWDPVENSSLVPWLTGTALLHSLMMQERRQAFKMWNFWLAVLTFVLCNFATFVTRSGIIQSVHAFGESTLGYYFMAFMLLCLASAIVLLWRRRGALEEAQDGGNLLSRETGLLFTNLLFAGTAAVVLVGTLFPTLVQLFVGRQGTLDVSFYERSVGPLSQIIVLFIGICPWLAWGGVSLSRLRRDLLLPLLLGVLSVPVLLLAGVRQTMALVSFAVSIFVLASIVLIYIRDALARRRATGEGLPLAVLGVFSRARRRYGGHLVHLGVVLIAIGITGSSLYKSEVQVALAQGESASIQGYTVILKGLGEDNTALRARVTAQLEVQRGGRMLGTVRPSQEFHFSTQQWITEVAIRSTLAEDLYVILAGVERDGLASFRLLINPLVIWLWIGGVVLLLGGALAWWPSRRDREAT